MNRKRKRIFGIIAVLFVLFFSVFSVSSFAYEICFDDLDNDNDGLVDCEDDVCEGSQCLVPEDYDSADADYICHDGECVHKCLVSCSFDGCDDFYCGTGESGGLKFCYQGECKLCDKDKDIFWNYDCGGNDCDDSNPNINPNAQEICNNGIDDNCNNLIDCQESKCQLKRYSVKDVCDNKDNNCIGKCQDTENLGKYCEFNEDLRSDEICSSPDKCLSVGDSCDCVKIDEESYDWDLDKVTDCENDCKNNPIETYEACGLRNLLLDLYNSDYAGFKSSNIPFETATGYRSFVFHIKGTYTDLSISSLDNFKQQVNNLLNNIDCSNLSFSGCSKCINPDEEEVFYDNIDNNCNGKVDCEEDNSEGEICSAEGKRGVCIEHACVVPESARLTVDPEYLDNLPVDKNKYLQKTKIPKYNGWNQGCSEWRGLDKCGDFGGTKLECVEGLGTTRCCFSGDKSIVKNKKGEKVCSAYPSDEEIKKMSVSEKEAFDYFKEKYKSKNYLVVSPYDQLFCEAEVIVLGQGEPSSEELKEEKEMLDKEISLGLIDDQGKTISTGWTPRQKPVLCVLEEDFMPDWPEWTRKYKCVTWFNRKRKLPRGTKLKCEVSFNNNKIKVESEAVVVARYLYIMAAFSEEEDEMVRLAKMDNYLNSMGKQYDVYRKVSEIDSSIRVAGKPIYFFDPISTNGKLCGYCDKRSKQECEVCFECKWKEGIIRDKCVSKFNYREFFKNQIDEASLIYNKNKDDKLIFIGPNSKSVPKLNKPSAGWTTFGGLHIFISKRAVSGNRDKILAHEMGHASRESELCDEYALEIWKKEGLQVKGCENPFPVCCGKDSNECGTEQDCFGMPYEKDEEIKDEYGFQPVLYGPKSSIMSPAGTSGTITMGSASIYPTEADCPLRNC